MDSVILVRIAASILAVFVFGTLLRLKNRVNRSQNKNEIRIRN
jgi:hypothetical protein